jgi:hypothetical protein
MTAADGEGLLDGQGMLFVVYCVGENVDLHHYVLVWTAELTVRRFYCIDCLDLIFDRGIGRIRVLIEEISLID